MSDFDAAVAQLWPAYIAAGMAKQATITSGTHSGATPYVMFDSPDFPRLDAAGRSRDFTIEYQFADLPLLAEGDTLTIAGVNFKVRERPYIKDDGAADGYFYNATLTKL